ncbi:unnamed protein product, partial [Brassica napus]
WLPTSNRPKSHALHIPYFLPIYFRLIFFCILRYLFTSVQELIQSANAREFVIRCKKKTDVFGEVLPHACKLMTDVFDNVIQKQDVENESSRSRDRGRNSRDRDREVDRHRRDRHSRERSERDDHHHTRSRSKRVSGFDMPPPSSAMLAPTTVAAAAGQVPSVLATPNIPGMFHNVLAMVPNQQLGALPLLPVQAMTQQATRHARRVYVGGLPPTANEQSVATFFSQVMSAVGGNTAGPGDAVVNVYINHEKKFAFVEMRSVEEASNAMALDGIILEGVPVKVKRPTDYNPSLAAALGPSQPNPNLNLAAVGFSSGSTGGLEGPDRLFVGGVPYYLTEDQIRELLESFGPLRGFNLVKDRETGNSMGYAFCVFQDPSVTDIACAALNGIKMGNKTLTVRRAVQGVRKQVFTYSTT